MSGIFFRSLCLSVLCLLIFFSCKKESSYEGSLNNKPPIANAGKDTIITLPPDSVQLDGILSYDPDGRIVEYSWRGIGNAALIAIINNKTEKPTIKNLIQGVYQFELTVTDNNGASAKDSVTVLVNLSSSNNRPPVANAGQDQTIILPVNTITVNGSASSDPDNNITNYKWLKISGPNTFTIANANNVQTQITSLVEGTYQFELKVTDAGGLSMFDTMKVVVAQSVIIDCNNRPIINATLIPIGNLSSARIKIQCGAAANKILFIGGWHSGFNYWNEPVPVDIYDISSNTWSLHFLIPDNPLFTHFRFGAGVASVGSKVLIGGGGDVFGDNQSSKVDIYDAASDSWSNAYLSSERQNVAAVTLGNKVFFAGGFGYPNGSGWGEFNTVDIYDNTSNTWATAQLSEARMDLTALSCNNKVYFAGGHEDNTVSKTIDIYDASSNSWSVSYLQFPRANMAGISVDDKLYWAEGYNSPYTTINDNVEIFNTNSGDISIECMAARNNITAVRKGNYIIFFTGDFGPGDPRTGIDFEIYNISTQAWSIGRLNQKVYNAAVISVNNTIYVAGGTDGNNFLTQVWKLEF